MKLNEILLDYERITTSDYRKFKLLDKRTVGQNLISFRFRLENETHVLGIPCCGFVYLKFPKVSVEELQDRERLPISLFKSADYESK